MAEAETAEIVTNIEEDESEAKDDGEASVEVKDDKTAVPVADSGLSQSEVSTPEVLLVEEAVNSALTPAATEEHPATVPADTIPDAAAAEPCTQSDEPPAAVPPDTVIPAAKTQSEEHESRSSAASLVEQGTFGIVTTPTDATTPICTSAEPAPSGTASVTKENIDEGETEKEEHDTAAEQQQQTVFVNHGLVTWEKSRRQWLNHKDESGDGTSIQLRNPNIEHAVPVNVDEIIDVVFASPRQLRANGGKGRNFPQPVTLPQMVDILQDLWEAEGLDV